MTADVAQRLGFNWMYTIRGFVTKARQETKRALKHGKSGHRGGYSCVVDRIHKDKIYRDRMIKNGVSLQTMLEWDEL